MKSIIISILVLTILSGSFSSVRADHEEPSELAGAGVILSGISIIILGIYDIASASGSAERYNASLMGMFPLRMPGYLTSSTEMFGQPKFSRAAFVKNPDLPIGYEYQPSAEKKSPRSATLWSLGATLIPTGIGFISMIGGGWNNNHTTLAIGIVSSTSGWVFGPSAGHWYAQQTSRGWRTALIRLGLLGVGFLSAAAVAAAS